MLASACRWISRASSPSALDAPYVSTRSRQLDQGQVPRRPGSRSSAAGPRRARKLRSLLVGVHRGKGKTQARPGRPRRHRLQRSGDAPAAARAQEGREQDQPVRRRRQPAQGSQHALGAARAGGRDRVRRLDRRRQCASGRVQGPARRQARRRGRGRDAREAGEDRNGPKPLGRRAHSRQGRRSEDRDRRTPRSAGCEEPLDRGRWA